MTLQAQYLEELYFLEREDADARGAKMLGATVNRFAVHYVREWLERRDQPAQNAQAALEAEAAQRNAYDRQEREADLASKRKKYFPDHGLQFMAPRHPVAIATACTI